MVSNVSIPRHWPVYFITFGVSVTLAVTLVMCGFCKKLIKRIARSEAKSKVKLAPESVLLRPFTGIGKLSKAKTKPYVVQAPLKKQQQMQQNAGKTSSVYSVNEMSNEDTVSKDSSSHSTKDSTDGEKQYLMKGRKNTKTDKSRGSVHLRLLYCPSMAQLNITLICAKNLPAMDMNGLSDPYCKIMLFPYEKKKLVTKIIQKNLNPYWNQTLCIKVPEEELSKQTLFIYVMDHDRIGRDDMIGEIRIQLQTEVLQNVKRGESLWRDIQICRGVQANRGQILVSLCYQMHSQALIINILKAKGLPALDVLTDSSDPYVKLTWYYKGIEKDKRRTKVIQQCLNPVFNESFSFYMSASMMERSCVMLTVKDYDRLGGNDTIGYVLMGGGGVKRKLGKTKGVMRAEVDKAHWQQTLNNPMHTVAEWYQIHKHKPL